MNTKNPIITTPRRPGRPRKQDSLSADAGLALLTPEEHYLLVDLMRTPRTGTFGRIQVIIKAGEYYYFLRRAGQRAIAFGAAHGLWIVLGERDWPRLPKTKTPAAEAVPAPTVAPGPVTPLTDAATQGHDPAPQKSMTLSEFAKFGIEFKGY
jgi:hypothetical protein